MHHRYFVSPALLGAAVLVAAAVLCSCAPKAASAAKAPQTPAAQTETPKPAALAASAPFHGLLEYAEGSVRLNGVAASIGADVEAHDEIRTGPDGLAEIIFNGANVIQIQANTVATLDATDLNLSSGSAALVLKGLAEATTGDRFRVLTPTAVGGVRGTVFYVKVESPDKTYICLCNGRLAAEDTDLNLMKALVTSHHHAVRVSRANGKTTVDSAPLLYHDDRQMVQLAQKVGYSIDWSKVE